MSAYSLALFTTLLWGVSALFDKLTMVRMSPLPVLVLRSLCLTVGFVAVAMVTGRFAEVFHMDRRSLLYAVISMSLGGFLGLSTYYLALKRGEVSLVTPIAGSYPLVTTVLAVLILQESLTPSRMLGTLLIIGGIFLLR